MFYLLDTFNKDIEEYCDAATAKVRQWHGYFWHQILWL